MIWIQLAILLGMILVGSRMQGIGLGVMGMIGMLIFVTVFHMRPGEIPLDVMMIILSIVTTAACVQAAGGLDYLVMLAEKVIRKNPSAIVFLGPITVYILALFSGTAHVVYSILPIIYEVSVEKKIRPERPLSISVIASHVALTGSPMAAATASLAAILAYPGASVDIMKIGIPACFIGVLAGAVSVMKMGKDMDKDPTLKIAPRPPATERPPLKKGAKTSVLIFGIAILMIVLAGSLPGILPRWEPGTASFTVNADGTLKMVTVIEIVTLGATALILLLTPTTTGAVVKASLFNSMAVAVVSVFGVVWMSSTFMAHNEAQIKDALGALTASHPWTFAIAIFLMGILMFSQAATTKIMMPLGLTLGLPAAALIAMFPAVNSLWVVPGYPTELAAIQMDQTGSTRIGKFVVNHSFTRAGVVTLVTAIVAGFLLARIML